MEDVEAGALQQQLQLLERQKKRLQRQFMSKPACFLARRRWLLPYFNACALLGLLLLGAVLLSVPFAALPLVQQQFFLPIQPAAAAADLAAAAARAQAGIATAAGSAHAAVNKQHALQRQLHSENDNEFEAGVEDAIATEQGAQGAVQDRIQDTMFGHVPPAHVYYDYREAGSKQISCMYLNERNFPWIVQRTQGLFPARELSVEAHYAPETASTAQLTGLQGSIAYSNESFYYVDADRTSETPNVHELYMPGMAESFDSTADSSSSFLPSFSSRLEDYGDEIQAATEVNSPNDVFASDLTRYLDERSSFVESLALSGGEPRQVQTDGLHVAWAQQSPSTGTYDVAVYNLKLRAHLDLELNGETAGAAIAAGLTRAFPHVCSQVLLYQEWDSSDARSSVWLHDMETLAKEAVGRSSATRSHFYPSMACSEDSLLAYYDAATGSSASSASSYSKGTTAEKQEAHTVSGASIRRGALGTQYAGNEDTTHILCWAAWLETGETQLQLDSSTGTVQSSTGAASFGTDFTVNVLVLPRRWSTQITPSQWSTGSYTVLHDMRVTNKGLLLSLREAGGTASLLRYKSHAEQSFKTLHNSETDFRVTFAAAQGSWFLMWQQVDYPADNSTTLALGTVTGFLAADAWYYGRCQLDTITQDALFLSAAMYKDFLVWRERSGTNTRTYLLDMDKDNDGVADFMDMFPTSKAEFWDWDNDLTGDASDIVFSAGPCLSSTVRGACVHDGVILYTTWACVMLLVCVCVCIYCLVMLSMKSGSSEQANIEAIVNSLESPIDEESQNEEDLEEMISALAEYSEKMDVVGSVVAVSLLAMTVFSILLVILPSWNVSPPPARLLHVFTWVDFYITSLFAIDLCVRFVLRDKREMPTLRAFLISNWYDLPALITDIPEVNASLGFLQLLVITRFLRLFRLLRVFKVFRAVRLYKRFTEHNMFLSFLVQQPGAFLSVFFVALVIGSSVALKLFDQAVNDDFVDILNVIWFVLVTVSTVGFGDLVPLSLPAQIVAVCLMMVGIGLIGTLSARLGTYLISVSNTSEKKKREMECQTAKDQELIRQGLSQLQTPYNPLTRVVGQHHDLLKWEEKMTETANAHVSAHFLLGTEQIPELNAQSDILGGGDQGKFSIQGQHKQSNRNRLRTLRVLAILQHLGNSYDYSVTNRLLFLLEKYNMASRDSKTEMPFDELASALNEQLFSRTDHTAYTGFLEPVLSLNALFERTAESLESLEDFELTDPLEHVVWMVEGYLISLNFHKRMDWFDIKSEFEMLLVLNDRAVTTGWALDKLCYRKDAHVSVPLFRQDSMPLAHMPSFILPPQAGQEAAAAVTDERMAATAEEASQLAQQRQRERQQRLQQLLSERLQLTKAEKEKKGGKASGKRDGDAGSDGSLGTDAAAGLLFPLPGMQHSLGAAQARPPIPMPLMSGGAHALPRGRLAPHDATAAAAAGAGAQPNQTQAGAGAGDTLSMSQAAAVLGAADSIVRKKRATRTVRFAATQPLVGRRGSLSTPMGAVKRQDSYEEEAARAGSDVARRRWHAGGRAPSAMGAFKGKRKTRAAAESDAVREDGHEHGQGQGQGQGQHQRKTRVLTPEERRARAAVLERERERAAAATATATATATASEDKAKDKKGKEKQ